MSGGKEMSRQSAVVSRESIVSRSSNATEREPVVTEIVRRRAEAEYMEMPGLKLTAAQASRLWHLDAAASATLLDSMVEAGVLYRTKDGAYLLLAAR
jgi:hypothetical protein